MLGWTMQVTIAGSRAMEGVVRWMESIINNTLLPYWRRGTYLHDALLYILISVLVQRNLAIRMHI
jgi:hypothetical protein